MKFLLTILIILSFISCEKESIKELDEDFTNFKTECNDFPKEVTVGDHERKAYTFSNCATEEDLLKSLPENLKGKVLGFESPISNVGYLNHILKPFSIPQFVSASLEDSRGEYLQLSITIDQFDKVIIRLHQWTETKVYRHNFEDYLVTEHLEIFFNEEYNKDEVPLDEVLTFEHEDFYLEVEFKENGRDIFTNIVGKQYPYEEIDKKLHAELVLIEKYVQMYTELN